MTKLPDIFRETNSGISNNPFRDIARMQRQMDRLFDNLWTQNGGELPAMQTFAPSCDIEETDSHYLMSFDLPGVKKEDLKIELRDNVLTVSGERNEKQERKTNQQYQSERFYGSFARSFSLPAGTTAEQIETEYKDGVLRIAVPKAEAQKTQQIKVGEAKSGFWDRLLGHKKEEAKPAAPGQQNRAPEKVA